MNASMPRIRRVAELDGAQIDALADVLIDCVEGGASVGFMLPLSRETARAFWCRVAAGIAAGERGLLVAEDARGLCGTVQLVLEQPENQPHRADLAKMLVHRRARNRGLGAALMREAVELAREKSIQRGFSGERAAWVCHAWRATEPAADERFHASHSPRHGTGRRAD